MTSPSGAASGSFGRTLEDLFNAAPTPGQAPVPGVPVLIEVPSLAGQGVDAAGQALRDLRLLPRVLFVEAEGDPNTVRGQDPAAGSFLRAGGQVTLYVIAVHAPTQFEQMVAAVREAIRPETLAKAADVTAAVQNLATKTDLQSAAGTLEREADAKGRFEELRGLITAQGGKPPSGPKSS